MGCCPFLLVASIQNGSSPPTLSRLSGRIMFQSTCRVLFLQDCQLQFLGTLCSLKILVLFWGRMNLCSGCKYFPHQRRISNMITKCFFSVYHFFFLVRFSSFFCLLQFAVMGYLNSRPEILPTMLSGHLAISIQVEFNHKFMRSS